MNKIVKLPAIILSLSAILIFQACKENNDQPPDSHWSDEDQESVDALLALQEEADHRMTDFLLTQDTAGAIASLAQWFLSDPTVEWAEAGSQGVMVKYKNGISGGYVISGEDEPDPLLLSTGAVFTGLNDASP